MCKIGWVTDLHLDYAKSSQREYFIEQLLAQQLDLLLIAGDIAESGRYKTELLWLSERLQIPLYFVLGNHDFYGSLIDDIRQEASSFCQMHSNLFYLTTEANYLSLTVEWALAGHDGWSDGRAGDYEASTIELRDNQEIRDLKFLTKQERQKKIHRLAQVSASQVELKLIEAFKQHDNVLLVTHAPPFIEACLYENHIADTDWAPHFVNQTLGESLLRLMGEYKKKSLLVLCGHTHHAATFQPLPNLKVLVGQASYGHPKGQSPLIIEAGKLFIE